MVSNVIFVLISSMVFLFVNSRGLIDGPAPTISNFLLSLLFLSVWYGFSFIKGWKKENNYIYFTLAFWGIGWIVFTCGFIWDSNLLLFLSIPFWGPMNGFSFFEIISNANRLMLIALFTLFPLGISILGWLSGLKHSKINPYII